MSVQYITLRLNTEKDQHRRIWEALRKRRDSEGCSYSNILLQALARDIERDATNEGSILQNCAERITTAAVEMMQSKLSAFMDGLAAGASISAATLPGTSLQAEELKQENDDDMIPDDEIPWDYLGG